MAVPGRMEGWTDDWRTAEAIPFWRVTSHQLTLKGSYSPSGLRHLPLCPLLCPSFSHLPLSSLWLIPTFLSPICPSLVTSFALSSSHNNASLSLPIFCLSLSFPLNFLLHYSLLTLDVALRDMHPFTAFVCMCASMHPNTVSASYDLHHPCMHNQKCVFSV